MSDRVTFEQVEQLAVQLPPPEQLKLVARISEQLSGFMPVNYPRMNAGACVGDKAGSG